ncbi:MAG TPA: Hsp20/alpha crystallin family protein [Bacillota bacterium]|nr:Hsp20/alpha crystallin family protein [Bacillota bacterium]
MFDLKPFKKKNEDFFERMVESFNEVFNQDEVTPLSGRFNSFRTDVKETKKAYYIEAELPGFDKEDISIQVDDDYLTIRAKRDEEEETTDEDDKIIRQERRYGEFIRRFYVDDIDEDNIKAKLRRGVLRIKIPKEDTKDTVKGHIEIE